MVIIVRKKFEIFQIDSEEPLTPARTGLDVNSIDPVHCYQTGNESLHNIGATTYLRTVDGGVIKSLGTIRFKEYGTIKSFARMGFKKKAFSVYHIIGLLKLNYKLDSFRVVFDRVRTTLLQSIEHIHYVNKTEILYIKINQLMYSFTQLRGKHRPGI